MDSTLAVTYWAENMTAWIESLVAGLVLHQGDPGIPGAGGYWILPGERGTGRPTYLPTRE